MLFGRSSEPKTSPEPERLTLDQLKARLDKFEERMARRGVALFIAVLATFVCASGWWFTSRDQSLQKRAQVVAECRATALAAVLDEFRTIVAPNSSAQETREAAARLEGLGSLLEVYVQCQEGG